MSKVIAIVLSLFLYTPAAKLRDERGLSQSTENAVLLAGAVTIAGGVIVLIGAYVQRNLPK